MEELFSLDPDHTFLRREALDAGYNDDDLRRACRDGLIARIRHGAYAPADEWRDATDLDKHKLRAHAVLRSHSSHLALSHTTAAVEHGMRLHMPDLSKVHVVCLDRKIARTTPDVVYHHGKPLVDEVDSFQGRPCVRPVLAGLQAASLCDVPSGLVILDSVVDLGLGDLDEIHRGFKSLGRFPHSRRLQVTVRLTRSGSQSVGETLGRHLMFRTGIPEPELQFEVRDEHGVLLGIVDFAWPEYGVLGEFDGMQKYGRLRRPDETPGDAVEREKTREDALREATQWLMIRFIWRELFDERRLAGRIRRQLERGRALRAA